MYRPPWSTYPNTAKPLHLRHQGKLLLQNNRLRLHGEPLQKFSLKRGVSAAKRIRQALAIVIVGMSDSYLRDTSIHNNFCQYLALASIRRSGPEEVTVVFFVRAGEVDEGEIIGTPFGTATLFAMAVETPEQSAPMMATTFSEVTSLSAAAVAAQHQYKLNQLVRLQFSHHRADCLNPKLL